MSSDTLEILERQELCADRVVGRRHNRLVIQWLETTRSVEDGIPTREHGNESKAATIGLSVV